MRFGRAAYALSLLALLAASLPGKTALPTPRPGDRAVEMSARALASKGWEEVGAWALTVEGRYSLREFRSPACNGAILLGAPPSNGELDTVLVEKAGVDGQLLYLQNNRLSPWPPPHTAQFAARLRPLLHRLGLRDEPGSAIVAVIQTGDCRNAPGLPWSSGSLEER